jgi:DNA polymerase-3 subunit delta
MSVFLFHGSDDVLVSEAVSDKVRELVGDHDRSLMLEEFDGDYVMAAVTEAANTPPFFTDTRVIVARGVSNFKADDFDVLAVYLNNAAEFTHLVLEWGSRKPNKSILDGLKKCGGQMIDPAPPFKDADRRAWWNKQLEVAGLSLDSSAVAMLIDWLGEDVARFGGIAETLSGTYGAQKITREKLAPFLGERGDVKPWDLTNALDAGNVTKALVTLRRLSVAGERKPLELLGLLRSHYLKLALLDGLDLSDLANVQQALEVKEFAAEKALKAYRNLTGAGVRRAFELLAAADLDLRGSTGLDEEVVMDVLVARLAKLTGSVSRQR